MNGTPGSGLTSASTLRSWLGRTALDVASGLLGGVFRHETSAGTVAIRLTEVEAYEGEADPGSHAYRGRSARNEVMFGPAGHLYCYRHLGLHHCVNLVCGPAGRASAVLLRAGEVVEGRELAWERRMAAGVVRRDVDLARGPARLTVALGLDLRHNGADAVAGGELRIEPPTAPLEAGALTSGPRVGVSGDGGSAELYPWRFWIADDPTVSAYRRA